MSIELRACCGVVVLDRRERVLLMRRRAEETWGLPGGGVVGAIFLASPRDRTSPPDGEASALGWFPLDRLPAPLFAPDVPVLLDATRRQDGPFIR